MTEAKSRSSTLSMLLRRLLEPIPPITVHVAPAAAPSETKGAKKSDTDEKPTLRELQVKEAEWVWTEMEDFVRLIQRYRGLFITAGFLSIGWLLNQALTAAPANTSAAVALDRLRQRVDIATVLCLVPLLTTLFFVLMLEAQFHMQSLARYRFLLGCSLGKGEPVWRWERWKEIPEGSIRAWTNPSNFYFALLAVVFAPGALWFGFPAVWNAASPILWVFWSFSAAVTVSLVILAIVIGLRNLHKNKVASSPGDVTWERLWPPETLDKRDPAVKNR